jgi:hypothetical protein
VTEQFLNAAQIGARIEQMRGIAVTQLVRRDFGIEPGRSQIPLQPQLNDPR